jgi:hypothetical protein
VFKEEAGGGGGFFYEARRCVAGWWGRAGPRVAVLGSRDHLDTGFAQRVLAFSFLPLFSIFFSGVLFFYWKNPECRPYTRPSGSCRFLDSTVADDFTYAGDARVTGAQGPPVRVSADAEAFFRARCLLRARASCVGGISLAASAYH